jgi:hypothetical protein
MAGGATAAAAPGRVAVQIAGQYQGRNSWRQEQSTRICSCSCSRKSKERCAEFGEWCRNEACNLMFEGEGRNDPAHYLKYFLNISFLRRDWSIFILSSLFKCNIMLIWRVCES